MLAPLLPDSGLEPWKISKEDQVLMTLRYLATNSHQTVIGDCFGVCQKAVSDVITRVVDALNHPTLEARFLRFWPSDEAWCLRRSREFARISRFTNVIGCVDGCLIRIQRPVDFGNHYYCRKACCAINMIAVVDARARFMYINCGLPPSSRKPALAQDIDSWETRALPTPGASWPPTGSGPQRMTPGRDDSTGSTPKLDESSSRHSER
ncbi:unnamed protein product [Cylicostephanus goldi]|uniref:Transposase Helix-turn-helix domain-containing protein n=1 Tax=Cylicostephanus goldi TaxID=71465 RepID=A0A3P6ULY0_CYLGO|nr:unnamed protein product [Cylicostephanus goldi]